MDLLQLLGRLHPLILHLPIGILVLAFLMAWLSRKEKYRNLKPALGLALQLGMWSAIFAAVSGYLLSWEGGYDEVMLSRHQWLGIATAGLSVALYLLYKRQPEKNFLPLFGLLMIVLGITGHLGGSLTHGSDFLTAPFSSEAQAPPVGNIDSANIFAHFIQPIFKEKCNSCHNPSKLKGQLLLTSIEGIQKGGKNGALFQPGAAAASLMMKRIHLPLEEKEHMPPKGKKQLNENEIALLQWWIDSEAVFDKRVADVEQPEEIKNILARYSQPTNSVLALEVPEARERKIVALINAGVKLERLALNKPFLSADLSGRQDLDAAILKQLKGISEQLVHLDLSNTNLDDQLLGYLNKFPHLQKLFLQKTKITPTGLEALRGLEYLEYLNLYETAIDDKAVEPLAQLAALQKLYLWRTNVSPSAVTQLENQHPRLIINTGTDEEIFGSSQLKPPLIVADKDIFKDTLRVSFEINFRNVDLFYTLDGSPPDSTSARYTTPFLIDKTADIQVIAQKQGWGTSEPARRLFARARYQAKKVTLNKNPNDRYAAEGARSLGDFKKGTEVFTEGNWLGFEKEHFTATFDLGEPKEVSKVIVSTLEDTNSWIFLPKGIHIEVSKDGRTYSEVARTSIPTTNSPKPAYLQSFAQAFTPQMARYIRIKVRNNLVNPDWHPAPGQPCWVFVDEIMIE